MSIAKTNREDKTPETSDAEAIDAAFPLLGGMTGSLPVGLVRPIEVRVDEIFPAPENSLYRKIHAADPKMQDLASHVLAGDFIPPIVVSRDRFIISGHRRHFAHRMAHKETIWVYVEDNRRDLEPDRFLQLLVDHNGNREKTAAEKFNEAVVQAKPDDCYQELLAYRKEKSAVGLVRLDMGDVKRRKKISHLKRPMANAIIRCLEELKEYWPISDRKVHYQLLNDPPLRNTSIPESRYCNIEACYKDTCDMLTRMRLTGEIPFDCIDDDIRTGTAQFTVLELRGADTVGPRVNVHSPRRSDGGQSLGQCRIQFRPLRVGVRDVEISDEQIVAPPSRHSEGGTYRWTVPLKSLKSVPIIDPTEAGFCTSAIDNDTDTTESVSVGSVLSVVSVLSVSSDIIQGTIPPGYGTRTARLFELARRIRIHPEWRDVPLAELKPLVQEWHQFALPTIRTKPFAETWADFIEAYGNTDLARCGDGAVVAMQRADATSLPVEALRYDSESVRRLVGFPADGQCAGHAGWTVGRSAPSIDSPPPTDGGRPMTLIIDPAGDVTTLYSEVLDLAALGAMNITRASHVELDDQGRWWAQVIDGPNPEPFSRRSEALAAEVAWLTEHRLGRT